MAPGASEARALNFGFEDFLGAFLCVASQVLSHPILSRQKVPVVLFLNKPHSDDDSDDDL